MFMRGQEKKLIVWGFKSDPLTFSLPPPFLLFILAGICFLNKPLVIMEFVRRKCRWVVEQDFHWNFQINFSCFLTFFSGLFGYCLKISPPPPAQVVSEQTLPMNIKTCDLTTDTRCGWVTITVLPNFFVACEGRGC